jgi:hypothetical protein
MGNARFTSLCLTYTRCWVPYTHLPAYARPTTTTTRSSIDRLRATLQRSYTHTTRTNARFHGLIAPIGWMLPTRNFELCGRSLTRLRGKRGANKQLVIWTTRSTCSPLQATMMITWIRLRGGTGASLALQRD